MVKGQIKTGTYLLLDSMLFSAVFLNGLPRFARRKLRRCAMFVGRANVQNIMSACAHIPCINIGGEHRADQISQMFGTINIWQGGGDQNTGHDVRAPISSER